MKFPYEEILNLPDMKVLDFQEIEGIGVVITIEKCINYYSCPTCGKITLKYTPKSLANDS